MVFSLLNLTSLLETSKLSMWALTVRDLITSLKSKQFMPISQSIMSLMSLKEREKYTSLLKKPSIGICNYRKKEAIMVM